ncbi:hypothetical protein MCAG_02615 [Micromonospora sp. ATCC 39149]|uniref:Uncharacterized protein n=1 Tax=Micromonospora carbonacea TaxID=47853 RepID=A0A7D5Y5U3_9ACTN|nr:hypothetical protein [Micromonospora sp. ATCC 39149]EEP72289.1 hypothetical protein MCAG_02615 [Micromonospora sp. ATCC 39149]QLJ98458.1 hypothetical protein HZU44_27940 [Micromonospora carbonacea]
MISIRVRSRRSIRPAGSVGGCESTDRVLHRANPGMFFDLADSDSITCYHCGLYVCVGCQTAPVASTLTFCDACP